MIIEGHDVEKATKMVDAMQSSRVGAAYLVLTVAPATEGKHAQIVHGLLNETDCGCEWRHMIAVAMNITTKPLIIHEAESTHKYHHKHPLESFRNP